MNKISRYILVFITILAAAVAIPNLYWLAFEKPVTAPFVLYSSLENEFFMIRFEGKESIRTDRAGNTYTRDEYEQKLPLFYARQLMVSGTMPDSINGREMDMHEINHYRSSFRYRPADLHMPDPGLYPLFEAESGRANLEMPADFFRITDRMEFVVAEDNSIDEKKSQMFTTVLNNREFNFPAKIIAGIPTTRKSCDEGYFVVDSKDMMYHIKMIEGKPFVKKFDVPDGLTFKHISCVDFSDKKFYCYLISADNSIYILNQDSYKFVRMPFEGFDPDQDELKIYGSMFHYTISSRREGELQVVALDDKYQKVDEYSETWPKRHETKQGTVASFLFPAQITLTDANSRFNNFYIEWTKNFSWLILNVLLIIAQFIIIRKTGLNLKRNIIDLLVIGLTGMYGFIGVNFFQNKFFE